MAVSLPTFEDREKLTAGKLNLLRDAIENKFSAITGADLTWPLVAQGNIDMNGFSIVNLQTFWNIVNAGEYTLDTAGFQLAINAAIDSSGGCVLVPPHTTIKIDGIDIGGSDITIMGCGSSSVLQLTAGSTSGWMMRTSTGLNNITIANLTMDGALQGTLQKGIIARQVTGFEMHRVWIKDFTGDAVELTNDGSNGNSCIDARLVDLHFDGGVTTHIISNDVDGLQMTQIVSKDATTDAILLEPTTTAGIIRDIQGTDIRVTGVTDRGIVILGSGALVSANQSRIRLAACQVSGSGGDSFEIGNALKIVQHVTLTGCTAHTSGDNGFVVGIDSGLMTDCYAHDATTSGADLKTSDSLSVYDCRFTDAGVYGIDAAASTDCIIKGCDVRDFFTAGILKLGSTNLQCGHNPGEFGLSIGQNIHESPNTQAVDGDLTTLYTKTIPGGLISNAGNGFYIRLWCKSSGTATPGVLRIKLDGTTVATITELGAFQYWVEMDVILRTDSGGFAPDAASNTEVGYYTDNTISPIAIGVIDASAIYTIDWTADVVLLIEADPGDTNEFSLHKITVDFYGGEQI
jgi:hypothetical protein